MFVRYSFTGLDIVLADTASSMKLGIIFHTASSLVIGLPNAVWKVVSNKIISFVNSTQNNSTSFNHHFTIHDNHLAHTAASFTFSAHSAALEIFQAKNNEPIDGINVGAAS
jgi:hypothetical protein